MNKLNEKMRNKRNMSNLLRNVFVLLTFLSVANVLQAQSVWSQKTVPVFLMKKLTQENPPWFLYMTGYIAKIFEEIEIPVISINSDLRPINYEGNRNQMFSYEAILQ